MRVNDLVFETVFKLRYLASKSEKKCKLTINLAISFSFYLLNDFFTLWTQYLYEDNPKFQNKVGELRILETSLESPPGLVFKIILEDRSGKPTPFVMRGQTSDVNNGHETFHAASSPA